MIWTHWNTIRNCVEVVNRPFYSQVIWSCGSSETPNPSCLNMTSSLLMRPRTALLVMIPVITVTPLSWLWKSLHTLLCRNLCWCLVYLLAIMDVLLSQRCGKILVGDPHQQIYTFRGAVNALQVVDHTHIYYLTQVSSRQDYIFLIVCLSCFHSC